MVISNTGHLSLSIFIHNKAVHLKNVMCLWFHSKLGHCLDAYYHNLSTYDLSHHRLGHPLSKVVSFVFKIINPSHNVASTKCFYDTCQYGNLKQNTFHSFASRATQPLELIHTNLWGSLFFVSLEGHKDYIHFIDDYNRFTWIFPLKFKFETKAILIHFHMLVKKQFNIQIKYVQYDWGGEYKPFVQYLASHSIVFKHPCPHTYQQNERVERKHKQIIKNGLTFLLIVAYH